MQYLQYIQPTGNRQTYSDTNLAITDVNTRFVFEYLYYEQPDVPGNNWSELIGTGYPNRIMIGTQSRNAASTPNIYIMWRNVQERVNNYTIDGTATFSKNGLTVNGTQVITISNPPSSIEAGVLCIGGVHNAPGDELINSGIKIGRLKVYDGSDNLIGDFVPANNNGTIGFYDEVGQVFYDSDGSQPWIAGPAVSSISADASKSTLASTGETISISVSCENAWTVTGDTFLTLSSTGDTGSTTITATAPSYTGATARTDTLTFTDAVTGDEAEITIKQKKYSTGQPFYLGADEIVEIYLGDDSISEAYLGEDLVFSSGSGPTPPPTPTGGSVSISIAYAADGPASANTYYLYSTDHMTGDLDEHHYILATATIVKDENQETYMTASAITDTGITSVVWDNPNSNLIFTGEFDTGYTYAVRYQGLDATDNKWYYGNCYDENSGDDTFTGDTNVSFVLPDFTDAGEYVKQLIITGFTGSDEQVYDYDGKFDFSIDDMGEESTLFYECDEDVALPPCPFSCVYDDTAHTLTVVAKWEEDTSYFIISKSPSDTGCVQYVNEVSWSEGEYTVTMGYGDGDEEPIDGCGE